jgi:hypothetical protein
MSCSKTKEKKNIFELVVIIFSYPIKPIRSTSATVCGNDCFNVSGNIKEKIAAINETIP